MTRRIALGLIFMLLSGASFAEAPSIELRGMDGKPQNVNEYIGKGKWAIVAVWAHDCLLCNREMPQLSAFHNDHKDRDAIVLGVSIDGMEQIEQAREFVSRHKLPFVNLLAEPEVSVMAQFDSARFVGTPTHYFYEPRGRMVARKVGPLPPKDIEEFIAAFNDSPYASP